MAKAKGHTLKKVAKKVKVSEGVMAKAKGYSLKEVAKKVKVSEATVVRWIDVRKVKITKKKTARGHYFFTEADLQKLKAHNESIN